MFQEYHLPYKDKSLLLESVNSTNNLIILNILINWWKGSNPIERMPVGPQLEAGVGRLADCADGLGGVSRSHGKVDDALLLMKNAGDDHTKPSEADG